MKGIVHTNSLTPGPTFLRFQRIFRMAHCAQTNLDEEAGIFWKDYEQFKKIRFGGESVRLAGRIFCWGKNDYISLTTSFPDYSERFLKVGSPRVDLWSPRFNSLFVDQSAKNPRAYVLIPSSLSGPVDAMSFEKRLRQRFQNGELEGNDDQRFRTLLKYAEGFDLASHYYQLVKLLSGQLDDIDIVIKPHPTESPRKWQDLVGHFEKVRIDSSNSTSLLIRQSVAVITTASTTGLEAATAGIPLINLKAHSRTRKDDELLDGLGLEAQSAEEAVRIFEQIGTNRVGQATIGKFPKAFEDKIFVTENSLAAQRIVDAWEGLESDDSHFKPLRLTLFRRLEHLVYWLFFGFFEFSLPLFRWSIWSMRRGRVQKHPPLDKDFVTELVRELSLLLGVQGKVEVSFAGKRSFKLQLR